MKVSLLVWDLSSHSMVRTYPIAKVLERRYEVEVLGPIFGDGIYEPYRGEFNYKSVKPLNSWLPVVTPNILRLIKSIEGKVIYAFKPTPTSYGVGLLSKLLKKTPVVLDIEDWDTAMFSTMNLWGMFHHTIGTSYSVNCRAYFRLMEHLSSQADSITVVSDFLQKRFGGVKLPHGADCSMFDPERFNREEIRDRWGVQDKKVVLFTGTAYPHKGLDDLALALERLGRKDVQLLIAGKRNIHLDKLLERKEEHIKYVGLLPHERMPELLCMSDMVVLPQRDELFTRAQLPGKIFEAMAMGKPIVATRVSDIPEILDGCGWVVEPGGIEQLAGTVQYVLDNPEEARRCGLEARRRCQERYSWDAMEKTLTGVFKTFE
ncbi:MAG: glycosyltransferase family 4 protein [Candidatus Altiarchaeota archaeon]